MIIIIGLFIWLMCGLFAVYLMIRDDPDYAIDMIQDDAINFFSFCCFVAVLGLVSLLLAIFDHFNLNEKAKEKLIKIIYKIGRKDE